MKISLHMLAHSMQDLAPRLIGEPTGRVFDRVHMQMDDGLEYDDCAVVRIAAADSSPESNQVEICVGKSKLVFAGHSAAHVMNSAQDVFAFYSNLEMRLARTPMRDHPEQAALSVLEEFIGPTLIYANDFSLLAHSRNYDDVHVNEFWEKYVVGHEVGENSVFDGWSFMGMTVEKYRMEPFEEPAAAPYHHGIFNSYLNNDGEIIGFVVVSDVTEQGPFDYDITSILMEALADIQSCGLAQSDYGLPWFSDEALAERLMMEGDKDAVTALSRRYPVEDKSFAVLAARIADERFRAAFHLELASVIGPCVSFSRNEVLLFLVWGNRDVKNRIVSRIVPYLERVNARMGISNPFNNASDANLFAPQALFALGQESEGLISSFFGSALSYMIHCSDESLRSAARHPAVKQLEGLSRLRGADLMATLREYLMCDRSIKRASEQLYLHRNTIIYRIDQAHQIAEFDLDDDYERHYLLYSLLV